MPTKYYVQIVIYGVDDEGYECDSQEQNMELPVDLEMPDCKTRTSCGREECRSFRDRLDVLAGVAAEAVRVEFEL